ncbi:MAG: NAD(P)-dependent glycerol-3-phosphate dehydrogenase [Planctomyces sp.]|nr:NAD(P)-dependent glycerol-3-phosphate dehydrogenase [Planctomyces sp.]
MRVAVLGAGGMGTACALVLGEQSRHAVTLWGRDPQTMAAMAEHRENRRLLPGIPLPPELVLTSDIGQAASGAEAYVVAIPTRYLRDTLAALAPAIPPRAAVVSVVKGIENETLLRPSSIIRDCLGPRPIIVLSGPCHAEEAARRLPASLVAACEDPDWAARTQEMFTTDRFRVYTNRDVAGVELAGALKNVIAIAAGISDGLGYGDNAKAALMTRGIVEMTRFGVALGAQASTFQGLAGIGDLITTCVSPHGRNRRVGERLARGEPLDAITASLGGVAEGVNACAGAIGLAHRQGVDMPIATEVARVLFEGKSPLDATDSLMQRPLRGE